MLFGVFSSSPKNLLPLPKYIIYYASYWTHLMAMSNQIIFCVNVNFFCANLNFKMVSFKLVEKLGGFCHGKSRMTETKRLITISSFECIMWLVVLYIFYFLKQKTNKKICQFWAKKEEEMVEFWIDFMDWFHINANIFYDLFVIFLKDIPTNMIQNLAWNHFSYA